MFGCSPTDPYFGIVNSVTKKDKSDLFPDFSDGTLGLITTVEDCQVLNIQNKQKYLLKNLTTPWLYLLTCL